MSDTTPTDHHQGGDELPARDSPPLEPGSKNLRGRWRRGSAERSEAGATTGRGRDLQLEPRKSWIDIVPIHADWPMPLAQLVDISDGGIGLESPCEIVPGDALLLGCSKCGRPLQPRIAHVKHVTFVPERGVFRCGLAWQSDVTTPEGPVCGRLKRAWRRLRTPRRERSNRL